MRRIGAEKKKRGGSLNYYHLGRRGPERRGGDGELRRISHAIFCQDSHHPEHLVHHQPNEDWNRSFNAIFYQLEVPVNLVHKLGYLWWRRFSVGPPFGVLPETRGHRYWWESPPKCAISRVQLGRHWLARSIWGTTRSCFI